MKKTKLAQAKLHDITITVSIVMINTNDIFVAANWESLKTIDQFKYPILNICIY